MKLGQTIVSGILCWGMAAVLFAADPEADLQQREETVVTSDELEMVSTETENHFYFTTNVEVKGNNLYASSDRMEVVSFRGGKGGDGTIGKIGAIDRIVLEGNVVIKQAEREATSRKAVIYPAKGEVVLSGSPVVRDSEGVVTGDEIVLLKSERRAIVKGGAGQRPTVILPGFQDLSYDDDEPTNP